MNSLWLDHYNYYIDLVNAMNPFKNVHFFPAQLNTYLIFNWGSRLRAILQDSRIGQLLRCSQGLVTARDRGMDTQSQRENINHRNFLF